MACVGMIFLRHNKTPTFLLASLRISLDRASQRSIQPGYLLCRILKYGFKDMYPLFKSGSVCFREVYVRYPYTFIDKIIFMLAMQTN